MFKSNTVVVLGAGASNEIGLPLGTHLKRSISKICRFKFDFGRFVAGDGEFFDELRRCEHFRTSDGANRIQRACQKISNGIGFVSSVDNFLEMHANDPDIQLCAKCAIASLVLRGERKSDLYVDQSNAYNRLSADVLDGKWYQELAHVLFEGVREGDVSDALGRVTFVSFNYDRCLEWFLLQAMTGVYALDRSKAEQLLSSSTVLHPYGDIGAVSWASGRSDFYGCESHGSLGQIASRILTYTEKATPQVVQRVRSAIQKAEMVVFLGFAFHAQNMDLLLSDDLDGTRQASTIIGTGAGMSEDDLRQISTRLTADFTRHVAGLKKKPNVQLVDLKCAEFLQRFKRTLSVS